MSGNSNGFDFSEFNELIDQLDKLGADMNQVAECVLNAGSEPARQAFQKNVPRSADERVHAQDNVVVSKTKKSKRGSKYRLIGALNRKFEYLYYVEYGTTKALPKPFLEKAHRDARAAAAEPMKDALVRKIEEHLR